MLHFDRAFGGKKLEYCLRKGESSGQLHQFSFISTSHVLPPVDWLVEDVQVSFRDV